MFANVSLGVLLPTKLDEETSSLPGWIVESNRAVRYIDSYHYSVPQGKRAIELLSGKEGIISQMVETTPNKPLHDVVCLGPRRGQVQAAAGDHGLRRRSGPKHPLHARLQLHLPACKSQLHSQG
ncbi:hypothetical protein OIU79_030704 [Salix purpurea]|uniref:Uncharacterized protein n=1 Tax=Salix purpurea TaxID=77065 RepID=A0A9Q0VB87_SALPP|nr:hypothetical protein OIU79_030704 [Salix purpurea]